MIIAHNDWDGVVSSKLVFPDSTPVLADYYELGSIPRDGWKVFFEVHNPKLMGNDDIVVDHHTPYLPVVPSRGLTAYIATKDKLLALSGNSERDYSNVNGVHSLLNRPAYISEGAQSLLRNAIDPPDWLIHISNVIDNPPLASNEREARIVVGHAYWRAKGLIREIARLPGERLLGGFKQVLNAMEMDGDRILSSLDTSILDKLDPSRPLLVLVDSKEKYYLAFALAYIAQLRGYPRVAYGYKVDTGYRLTFASRDEWALETARKLGGGGRPTPTGTVGGTTVSNISFAREWFLVRLDV